MAAALIGYMVCLCGQLTASLWYGQGTICRRIGLRGIAHPDPHEGVLLHYREAAHARAIDDAVLARDMHACARMVEDQPVIAALQPLLDDLAHVQRRAAVAAHVQQRRGAVLAIAEQHDGLVADATGQRRLADFVGPGSDVPGVADEHRRISRVDHRNDIPAHLAESSRCRLHCER